MTKALKILLLPVIAIFIDQVSKWWIRQTMSVGESITVLNDFLRITHVQNRGQAFGIDLGNYMFFTVVSILVAGIIGLYFYRMRTEPWFIQLPFVLILSGAIGNLIDRLMFQSVTDFIDVDIPDIVITSKEIVGIQLPEFVLLRWPVFNAADAYVTVGMVLLFWLIIFKDNKII